MTAGMHNDPHLVTFDGLRFDCMATGEFVLFHADSLRVHGRFSGPTTSGSVMNGVVVAADSRKLQIHVTSENATDATMLQGCKVRVMVDGIDTLLNGTAVSTAEDAITFFPDTLTIVSASGLRLTFSMRDSSYFGCYFESNKLFVPTTLTQSSKVLGLLGNANGDPRDDWITANGSKSSSSDLFKKEQAYKYCTTNWCIRDAALSLFVYENGTSHASFDQCDKPYEKVDTSSASASLRAICGSNDECLTDGIVTGDMDEARRTLEVQADLDASRQAPTSFKFEPSAVTANVSTNVQVVVESSTQDATEYKLYRVPNGGFAPALQTLLVLPSLGGGRFGATLAVRAQTAGDVQSFVAYPVVDGQERRTDADAIWALNAVRSFTAASGIGSNVTKRTTVEFPALPNNATLRIQYTWPLDQPDLDTGTFFLNQSVGFRCTLGGLPRRYLDFSGDDTSRGGIETVTVFLSDARDDGNLKSSTDITLKAGWYLSSGAGAATVRVSLLNGATEIVGDQLETVINPGAGSPGSGSCIAAPSVGVVKVNLNSKLTITLDSS